MNNKSSAKQRPSAAILIFFMVGALAAFLRPTAHAAAELAEPAKSVLEHYMKIQSQLAQDSMKDVSVNAAAIAAAANSDQTRSLPAKVGKQADLLAKANNLAAAREAFKPLSDSLIKYLESTKAGAGEYRQAYCPMVKASWLQTGKDIKNPYMGKEMLDCGEFKN